MTKRTFLTLLAAILVSAIAGWFAFRLPRAAPLPPEISRQELLAEARAGHLRDVTIWDGSVITGVSSTRGRFRTVVKADPSNLVNELRGQGIRVSEAESPDSIGAP